MRSVWLYLFLGVSMATATSVMADVPRQIQICGMEGEWPPYAYFKRENGKITGEVVGSSISTIKKILGKHHISATITLIPWRRCLAEVASGRYAMLLDASVNAERERSYLISRTFYTLHDVYFYSANRPAPKIETVADLRIVKICGEAGFNYLNFDVPQNEIDAESSSFKNAMDKLKAGRCDAVLGRLEIAAGHRYVNGIDYTQSTEFEWRTLPGTSESTFHIMISRNVPFASELLDLINRELADLIRNSTRSENYAFKAITQKSYSKLSINKQ